MAKSPEPKIEWIDRKELIPYVNNAKLHPEAQIKQIAASIREFGFNDPIGIDSQNNVIEGHGRLMAAELLNLEKVPVIRLDHLTEAQRKAYMLAHNKLTINTGFDQDKLRLELERLQELELDGTLTGFTEDEIEELLLEPDFEPTPAKDQGRLDERTPIVCPNCGHEFEPPAK